MVWAIYGFIFCFIIPYMARRFAKFMPAAAPVAVWRLVAQPKHSSWAKRCANFRYCGLLRAYFGRCFMFGLAGAGLFAFAFWHFGENGLAAIGAFLWALLLLIEIDYKTLLLPDVITVPLLIGGFLFSSLYGMWVISVESAAGAVCGYLIPLVAALLIVRRRPDAIGGGDIKLLAAVGAWLGVMSVIYVILLSCLLFALQAVVMRQRAGAFGPAIAIAAIIVAFYFF